MRFIVAAAWVILVWGLAPVVPALAQTPEDVSALNAQALKLHGEGRYVEAVALAERSLAIGEKVMGPDHPKIGEVLNNLAALYYAQGRYDDAEPFYRRSLSVREKALGPEHPEVAQVLNNLALLYLGQGRPDDAEPLLKRGLAVWEKTLGPNHPHVATALAGLAALYRDQGRYGDAVPLMKRSLAIREKALGPEHHHVAIALADLATLLYRQGHLGEAEPLYERALVISEKALGPEHPQYATALQNLAALYRDQGRYAEAEPLSKRSLAIREKALRPDHPRVAEALRTLAKLYSDQGRYSEAEPLFKRSLAIRENTRGSEHPEVAQVLNNLAQLYIDQGRYGEAEPLFKRSVAIYEQAVGPEHEHFATAIQNLAELYRLQGRYGDAVPLMKRSLAIREKALRPDHPGVAEALHNLAELYRDQGRYSEAEPLYKRNVAISEKAVGPKHPEYATALQNLGEVYRLQGRYAEPELLFKRSLAIRENALGPEHPYVAQALSYLAELYRNQGRYDDAELFFKRSLAISEQTLGPEHIQVATALNALAESASAQRDWAEAAARLRASTGVLKRRATRGLTGDAEGAGKGEAQRYSQRFKGLVKVTDRLVPQGRERARLGTEMFETAQWAQGSEAATSLAQMAVRGATGDTRLSALVRERQDLVGEWQANDKLLIAARTEAPDKRNAEAEKALAVRLNAIDTRLAAIDAGLAKDFPDYAALASPKPVSVADVQAALTDDEALVLFLDTHDGFKPLPEETFVWVVTKTGMRWLRSELGSPSLKREVMALRCGLDAATWDDNGGQDCSSLLSIPARKAPKVDDPLPFDHSRAHKLYAGLFGQVGDLIKGKHLLIVPSGALARLPFQVLVTAPPRGDDHKDIAWLVRDHPITVLPAVSSLKALRGTAKPSAASKPMIGFGNPLLDGNQAHPLYGAYYKQKAAEARTQSGCAGTTTERTASLRAVRRGIEPIPLARGYANLAHIKIQAPLPETADELCAVARDLGTDVAEIRIGAKATEQEVRSLSASGALAKYRVLHFATHGALAGQLSGATEPGLILTPPPKPSEEDDGYLSTSEIAGLKLDAEWVILSACNTAGGDESGEGAEALSGLARAFFYAQARALLVSHWAVDSNATVKLITGAVGETARDPEVGRAEALRRAMLALIEKGADNETHPAYWAPFVVVGEGGDAK